MKDWPKEGGHARVSTTQAGDIVFSFQMPGGKIASWLFTPQQAASTSSHLLRALAAVTRYRGELPTGDVTKVDLSIPANRSFIAGDDAGGSLIGYQIGSATIGFKLHPEETRLLTQGLLTASWGRDQRFHLGRLFRRAVGDCAIVLRGFGGVLKARFKASSRRRATSIGSIVSGRSWRCFRTIELFPGLPHPRYAATNECIYCGSIIYSTPGEARSHPEASRSGVRAGPERCLADTPDIFWGGSLGCDGSFGFERRGVGADGAADHRSA